MSMSSTYQQSLKQLVRELAQAILEIRAYEAVWNCHTKQGLGFFRIAFDALNENATTHAMKILDRHPQVASFWAILREKKAGVDSFCMAQSISLAEIGEVADKLKSIRDRGHFHLDSRNVSDPKAVWLDADLKNLQFTKVLGWLWQIFDHLHEAEYGENLPSIEYVGSDVEPIFRAAKEAGAVTIIFKNDQPTA